MDPFLIQSRWYTAVKSEYRQTFKVGEEARGTLPSLINGHYALFFFRPQIAGRFLARWQTMPQRTSTDILWSEGTFPLIDIVVSHEVYYTTYPGIDTPKSIHRLRLISMTRYKPASWQKKPGYRSQWVSVSNSEILCFFFIPGPLQKQQLRSALSLQSFEITFPLVLLFHISMIRVRCEFISSHPSPIRLVFTGHPWPPCFSRELHRSHNKNITITSNVQHAKQHRHVRDLICVLNANEFAISIEITFEIPAPRVYSNEIVDNNSNFTSRLRLSLEATNNKY